MTTRVATWQRRAIVWHVPTQRVCVVSVTGWPVCELQCGPERFQARSVDCAPHAAGSMCPKPSPLALHRERLPQCRKLARAARVKIEASPVDALDTSLTQAVDASPTAALDASTEDLSGASSVSSEATSDGSA